MVVNLLLIERNAQQRFHRPPVAAEMSQFYLYFNNLISNQPGEKFRPPLRVIEGILVFYEMDHLVKILSDIRRCRPHDQALEGVFKGKRERLRSDGLRIAEVLPARQIPGRGKYPAQRGEIVTPQFFKFLRFREINILR